MCVTNLHKKFKIPEIEQNAQFIKIKAIAKHKFTLLLSWIC